MINFVAFSCNILVLVSIWFVCILKSMKSLNANHSFKMCLEPLLFSMDQFLWIDSSKWAMFFYTFLYYYHFIDNWIKSLTELKHWKYKTIASCSYLVYYKQKMAILFMHEIICNTIILLIACHIHTYCHSSSICISNFYAIIWELCKRVFNKTKFQV